MHQTALDIVFKEIYSGDNKAEYRSILALFVSRVPQLIEHVKVNIATR